MGNILTLLGIVLVGAGTVSNIFAENTHKEKIKDEPKTEPKTEPVPGDDPVKKIIG